MTNTPQAQRIAGIQPQAAGINQAETQQAQHRIGRKSGVIQPLGLLTNQGAKFNQPEVKSPQPEVTRSPATQPEVGVSQPEVRPVQPEVRTPVNPTSVTIKKVPPSKQDLSRTNRLGSLIRFLCKEIMHYQCNYYARYVMLLGHCVCLRTESLVPPRNPFIQLYLQY